MGLIRGQAKSMQEPSTGTEARPDSVSSIQPSGVSGRLAALTRLVNETAWRLRIVSGDRRHPSVFHSGEFMRYLIATPTTLLCTSILARDFDAAQEIISMFTSTDARSSEARIAKVYFDVVDSVASLQDRSPDYLVAFQIKIDSVAIGLSVFEQAQLYLDLAIRPQANHQTCRYLVKKAGEVLSNNDEKEPKSNINESLRLVISSLSSKLDAHAAGSSSIVTAGELFESSTVKRALSTKYKDNDELTASCQLIMESLAAITEINQYNYLNYFYQHLCASSKIMTTPHTASSYSALVATSPIDVLQTAVLSKDVSPERLFLLSTDLNVDVNQIIARQFIPVESYNKDIDINKTSKVNIRSNTDYVTVSFDLLTDLLDVTLSIASGNLCLSNRSRVRNNSKYQYISMTSRLLESAPISSLNDKERMCFYSNLLNILRIFSFIENRNGSTCLDLVVEEKLNMFTLAEIGNVSVFDIEHQLLQRSLPASSTWYDMPPLSEAESEAKKDRYAEYSVHSCHPLIAFAVWTGTEGSPGPIPLQPHAVDELLTDACKAFLSASVYVSHGAILVPSMIQEHESDLRLCGGNSDISSFLLNYLPAVSETSSLLRSSSATISCYQNLRRSLRLNPKPQLNDDATTEQIIPDNDISGRICRNNQTSAKIILSLLDGNTADSCTFVSSIQYKASEILELLKQMPVQVQLQIKSRYGTLTGLEIGGMMLRQDYFLDFIDTVCSRLIEHKTFEILIKFASIAFGEEFNLDVILASQFRHNIPIDPSTLRRISDFNLAIKIILGHCNIWPSAICLQWLNQYSRRISPDHPGYDALDHLSRRLKLFTALSKYSSALPWSEFNTSLANDPQAVFAQIIGSTDVCLITDWIQITGLFVTEAWVQVFSLYADSGSLCEISDAVSAMPADDLELIVNSLIITIPSPKTIFAILDVISKTTQSTVDDDAFDSRLHDAMTGCLIVSSLPAPFDRKLRPLIDSPMRIIEYLLMTRQLRLVSDLKAVISSDSWTKITQFESEDLTELTSNSSHTGMLEYYARCALLSRRFGEHPIIEAHPRFDLNESKGSSFEIDFQSDEPPVQCLECFSVFGEKRPPRSCRLCGRFVCSQCSQHRVTMVWSPSRLRACQSCFADFSAIDSSIVNPSSESHKLRTTDQSDAMTVDELTNPEFLARRLYGKSPVWP